ncbi:MAG TPA: cell envelope integrity protein CreD [Myxococcota bacterium]|nr:cell envelope integrity protein CreD [Myxococcota bacterium]
MKTSVPTLQQILTNRGTIKAFAIACLCGLMWIPIQFIEDLIAERNIRMRQVQAEMGRKWGGGVRIEGPLMLVPSIDGEVNYAYAPENIETEGRLVALERYRGIFRYPTYEGDFDIKGSIQLDKNKQQLDWQKASLVFLLDYGDAGRLPDYGGRPRIQVTLENEQGTQTAIPAGRPVQIGGARILVYSLPLDMLEAMIADDFSFSAHLTVMGSVEFMLRPIAKNVMLHLASNWRNPSFAGDRLPNQRNVGQTGFQARWKYSVLGFSFPYPLKGLPLAGFPSVGLRLVQDVSLYQIITRSIKYALLIIVLTFAVFFLFEVISGLHIHVVQYLFVGCALVLFYLLLLSCSEHIPFSWSYLIASASAIVLVTGYTRAILATTRHALFCGGGLAALYAILYFILNEERYALLVGSWTLFAVLALLMFLTRKVKWPDFSVKTESP